MGRRDKKVSGKAIEIKKDEKEPVVVKSVGRREFAALIERYKKQNPVKYGMKKAALEAKLKSL